MSRPKLDNRKLVKFKYMLLRLCIVDRSYCADYSWQSWSKGK